MHVHGISGEGEARFWLEPDIEPAKNYRYTRMQLKEIEGMLEEHKGKLSSAREQHFGN